jgi:hypothetical protein
MLAKTFAAAVHGVDARIIEVEVNTEKTEVVANCNHLKALKFSKTNPLAFTEHGAVILASVLNTAQAVQTSILVWMIIYSPI